MFQKYNKLYNRMIDIPTLPLKYISIIIPIIYGKDTEKWKWARPW